MRLRALLHRVLGLPSTRAIRGATTVMIDDPLDIDEAVAELVDAITVRNGLSRGEIISAIFTVTADLSSTFPAGAARAAGWHEVPLLCTTEIPVPDGMPRCIRVLVHVERVWGQQGPRHVYLREAVALRPDLHLHIGPAPVGAFRDLIEQAAER
ncbi:MAG TPA: chorismate mutase [Gemmatimonadales bacterium]|nr:chorismate mutase [Gemmatimonadales bacterium]